MTKINKDNNINVFIYIYLVISIFIQTSWDFNNWSQLYSIFVVKYGTKTRCAKEIKCSTSLAFYLFSQARLINSIKHDPLVRNKENDKLNDGGPNQRQSSGTNPPMRWFTVNTQSDA